MLHWQKFIKALCLTAIIFGGLVYLFIILVDPYDSVPFSLPLEREPISTNQRFAYPALARNPVFDSAIIGTSTARLLKPERLNELTGNNWVNLAMNSATAYEQMEMLKLFLRHHPEAKQIVIGIDDAWCRPGQEIQKFTFRPFPPWMYDDNRWNDLLYLFNDKSFENAVRMIEYWTGKREAKYDRTGYRDFTEDFGGYNLEVSRARLYPSGYAKESLEPQSLRPHTPLEVKHPSHYLLQELDIETLRQIKFKVLFMPLHAAYLNRGATNYMACKGSILRALNKVKKFEAIDHMKVDQLTMNDTNYWDPLHYVVEVARVLEREIVR